VLAYFEKATNIWEQAVEMVEWINQEVEMDDDSDISEESDDLAQDWKQFPRMVFKVMNANTYLFTSLIEMSHITDPNIFLKRNLFIVYKVII
jgi:hypothetical protein